MSEAVETTEIVAEEVRQAETEVKKHEGVFYIPAGSVCDNFEHAVSQMYVAGYSLHAMQSWFSIYQPVSNIDIIKSLIETGYAPSLISFGRKLVRQSDIDWLECKLFGGVKKHDTKVPDIGVASVVDEMKEAADFGLAVEDPTTQTGAKQDFVQNLVDDPLQVFRQMNTYTLMVAQGLSTALLITGQGGVGKSYNVGRILSAYGKKGKDYVVMKGRSTIAAMYKFLYDNYDKTVVFDDCDSVLQDNDGLNILKGVLDTGEIREVSWNNSRTVNTFGCETHEEIEAVLEKYAKDHKKIKADLVPSYFRFMGSCIFISNLSAADLLKNAAMAPLLTRCNTVDIQLTPDEVITKMEVALPGMHIYDARGKDITRDDLKQEVFEYIKSPEFLNDQRLAGKQISFRIFHQAYKFRYAGFPNWKDLSFCV